MIRALAFGEKRTSTPAQHRLDQSRMTQLRHRPAFHAARARAFSYYRMQQILAICLCDPQSISGKRGGPIPEADPVAKYLTLNQLPISLVLRCTTLIRLVAVTDRQDRADPILGPRIRAQEEAKEIAAAAGRAQNLTALKACALLLAAFVAIGLIATVMTKSDSAGGSDARSARVRLPATPVLSDDCDLAGAIPNCKKVMTEMATYTALKGPSLFRYVPWGN